MPNAEAHLKLVPVEKPKKRGRERRGVNLDAKVPFTALFTDEKGEDQAVDYFPVNFEKEGGVIMAEPNQTVGLPGVREAKYKYMGMSADGKMLVLQGLEDEKIFLFDKDKI